MKQPKLLTLNDFNPENQDDPMNHLIYVRFLGENDTVPVVIANEVLYSIVKQYGEDGKDEIMKMVDRGQISQEDAEDVLGDEYEIVASRVPCVWESI